jgi:hypothetical protein
MPIAGATESSNAANWPKSGSPPLPGFMLGPAPPMDEDAVYTMIGKRCAAIEGMGRADPLSRDFSTGTIVRVADRFVLKDVKTS